MKKIISLLLALACVFACAFAMTSCGEDNPPPAPEEPTYAEAAAAFISAYNALNRTTVKVTDTVETIAGPLSAVYTITVNSDGTKTVTGYREEFTSLGEEGDKKQVALDGTYTDDAKIDIDSAKITDYSVSATALRITVKAADTAEVIGTAFPSDTVVVINLAEGAVTSVSLSYVNADSASVSTVFAYN